MKTSVASVLGLALTVTSTVAVSGVEYQDTNLHRSDDMVRFDRAYRAGLHDGTTTIIYTGSNAPGAVPEKASASELNQQFEPSMSQHRERKRLAANQSQSSGGSSDSSGVSGTPDRSLDRYQSSVPEKMQDDRYAEKRRYPPEEEYRSDSRDIRKDDCDCSESGKRRAPRSEPVEPSVAKEPNGEATMREKLEAVRKARELLRQSRKEEVAGGVDDSASDADGSATLSLIEHGKEVTADTAPLTPYELDPDYVRNQEVSVEFGAATIEEIANQIMPRGWRVRLSTSDQEVHEARYEFVSSDAREVALRKLLYGTGLGYKMFFNLKDDHGNPSPLLVISEVNS